MVDDAMKEVGAKPRGGIESVNLETPEVVLAIGAHPDDIEFDCGATLAKWARAGALVHLLICTDGSKGSWDANADPTELAKRRQTEQMTAAESLGANGQVRFLGAEDGELKNDDFFRSLVVRAIRELKPTIVLGHDPWKRWRLHPDHREAGWLCVDAVVAARDPHYYRDLNLPHHRPRHLLLFECEEPNHLEIVTEDHLDAKASALLCHVSQFETTMGINNLTDTKQVSGFRQRIFAEASLDGKFDANIGGQLGSAGYGESFRLIDPAS